MITSRISFRADAANTGPQQTDIIAAQPAPVDNPMEVKPDVGIVTPPNTLPQHSFVQEQQQMLQDQDTFNSSTPIANQPINSNQQQSKTGSQILKFLLWGGGIAGAILLLGKFGMKKVDTGEGGEKIRRSVMDLRGTEHTTIDDILKTGQSIYDDIRRKVCVNLDQLKAYKTRLIKNSEMAPLKKYNLDEVFIRLRGQTPAETKQVLETARDVVCEARNVKGFKPQVTILMKEGSEAIAPDVAEAFKTGKFSKLTQAALKRTESISIDYVPTKGKFGVFDVEAKVAKIVDQSAVKAAKEGQNIFSKIWEAF